MSKPANPPEGPIPQRIGGLPRFDPRETVEDFTMTESWRRAQQAVDTGGRINKAERMVSLSDTDGFHRVVWTLSGASLRAECECKGYTYRDWCAHLASLWWRTSEGQRDKARSASDERLGKIVPRTGHHREHRWYLDSLVILDYKDEFRGLKASEPGGFASWYAVGPRELDWSVSDWRAFLRSNPKVILAKHQLSSEKWREVCSRIIAAGRQRAGAKYATLIAVDEAHVVAPQSGKTPEPTTNLATTGRGEGASSLWMDQRPAALEKDVRTQADETLIGGFMRSQDRDQIDAVTPANLCQQVRGPTL